MFLANETWAPMVYRMTAERSGKKLDTLGLRHLPRRADGRLTDHLRHALGVLTGDVGRTRVTTRSS
ncbi:hypothetical protein SAMN05216207_104147 [Pseudonocardia ammonioxydans]|uniref:Uncharacterized protein n=1 Tax=Pseudonocardia ammonioxydans TaxID=260086 RepID=A0A1I5FY18_PSUAM|nr:hypothetical protein SAMN05216207_104147 [Pseudonocardia ammonioxydans]